MSLIRLVLNKTNLLREVSSDTSLLYSTASCASCLLTNLFGELAMTNSQTIKLKGKCIKTDCYNSVVSGIWCRGHLPPKRKNGKNIRAKLMKHLAEQVEQTNQARDARRASTKQKIALIGQNLNA